MIELCHRKNGKTMITWEWSLIRKTRSFDSYIYIFIHEDVELVIGAVDTAQVVTEFDQYVAPKYQRKENNFCSNVWENFTWIWRSCLIRNGTTSR